MPARHAAILVVIVASAWSGCGGRGPQAPAAAPIAGEGDDRADHGEGAGGGRGEEAPRHPCDPFGSQRAVDGPPHPPAVCGNGVIDTVWGDCAETCTGGCDRPTTCRVDCASTPEACDGAATTYTCESQGYVGGVMGCTAGCGLDVSTCLVVAPGAPVRTGVAALAGDVALVISDGTRAAVFAVDAESSALSGATVTASLRTRRLRKLPAPPLAVGALGDRLGFVAADRRFGTIDLAGKVTMRGSVGDASSPAFVLAEVGRPGAGAVLLGDYQRRVLTVFDAAGAPPPAPVRMFASDNLRVVVIDGAHPLAAAAGSGGKPLVIMQWGGTLAFIQAGDHLEPLAAPPTGLAFTETPESIDDTITWSGGGVRFSYPRAWTLYLRPPAGLSKVAVAGAGLVAAFGGTLFAHADGEGDKRRVDLFWLAIPDPLAATVASP